MLQKPVGNLHWDAFLLGSMEMSGRLPSPKAVDWRSWWRFLGASIRNVLQYASYILSYIYILLFIYYHCLCTYIILHDYDMNIWYVDTWYVDIWYILYRYIILIDTYIYMWIIRLCRAEKNTSNVAFLVGILNPSSVQRNEFFAMHSDLPWHLPQRSETIFMTEFPIFNDIMIDDIV